MVKRLNPITGQREDRDASKEFPKSNQTIIVPGGFNPSRYYSKSEMDAILANFQPAGDGGGAPSGPAGGVLGGTYPDPDFAVNMATQAELDAVAAAKSDTGHGHVISDVSGLQSALDGKLDDSQISDTAYDATSWNGSTDAPTKNAVRDKFESLSSGGQTLVTRIVAAAGGDHTTLQAALSAASAGDTIYVRAGTYQLTGATSSSLANIRIVGENPETSIIDLDTRTLTLSGANVTVEGLKFINGTAGNIVMSGTDARFNNNWFLTANTTAASLTMSGLRGRVHFNLFDTTSTTIQDFIVASGGSIQIQNNMFKLGGVSGSGSVGIITLSSGGSCFNNNNIRLTTGSNSSGNPIVRITTTECQVNNNFFLQVGNRATCAAFDGGAGTFSGNLVSNCYTAVTTLNSGWAEVVGNYIYDISGSGYGIHFQSPNNIATGNKVMQTGSTGSAIRATGDSNTISANQIEGGQYGVRLPSNADYNTVTGNTIRLNATGMYGVECSGLGNTITGNNILGFSTSGGRAVYVDGRSNVVSGNNFTGMGTGIQSSTSATYCTFQGNEIDSVATGLDISSDYSLWSGNIIRNTTTDISYGTHNKSNSVFNNQGDGINAIHETLVVWMKNTSGSTINAGAVVTYKAVAAGNEITTTTNASDNLVYGVATENISNNSFGPVQIKGKTTLLKVNGTTDIAVGDFLTTFTTAEIAKKAANPDLAFAIALEAYATDDSSGVVDALIIEPRRL